MPLSTRLFPPLSLKEILEELGSFSDQEFDLFLSETLTSAAFDASPERCDAVARKLDKDPGLLGYIFGALGLLYREVRRKAKDEKTLKLLIEELLNTFEIASSGKTDVNKLTDRLVRLLSYNESAERRDKIGRLKKGFIPNALGFSSFVDLRPNYDPERTKVTDFVPLVQFRIRTDSEDERDDFLVFQLDEPALERLGEAIKDIQKKLEVIKRDAVSSGRIVK
jgi:hypothetical protein